MGVGVVGVVIYCLFFNPKTYFSLSSFLCFLIFILYPVSYFLFLYFLCVSIDFS